jgi:DNA-binding NarL/FixJ family response regulator
MAERNAPNVLTSREREVLTLVARGYGTREIAQDLGLTEGSVRSELQAIRKKLGVRSQVQAVAAAMRLGWIEP